MHEVKKLKEITKKSSVRNVNVEQKEKLSVTDKIALWVINKVGTFGFAVFCICLTVTPFIVPATMTVVMFISSSFLQLVLLPLIMIGQNLQSAHAEARAEADFEINKKAEDEIRTVLAHLENQNDELQEQNKNILIILEKLNKK